MLTAWVILLYANAACIVALLAVPRDQLVIRTMATVLPTCVGIAGFLYMKYGMSLAASVDVLTSIGVLAQFLVPSLYLVSIELEGEYARALLDYIDYFPEVAAVAHVVERRKIALAGRERCIRWGYDYHTRMRWMLDQVAQGK